MPFPAYMSSCFFGIGSVKDRLNAIRSRQSMCTSPATPFPRMRRAWSSAATPPISIFFGSQPRSAHVPPKGRKSTMATVHPALRTRIAATIAAVPVPMMTRSYLFIAFSPASAGTSPSRRSRTRSNRPGSAAAARRSACIRSGTGRRRSALTRPWRSGTSGRSAPIRGSARSLLRRRRIAGVRGRLRQGLERRLAVVVSHDRLLFLVARRNPGDARHSRNRLFHRDRTRLAVHARQRQRNGLHLGPGRPRGEGERRHERGIAKVFHCHLLSVEERREVRIGEHESQQQGAGPEADLVPAPDTRERARLAGLALYGRPIDPPPRERQRDERHRDEKGPVRLQPLKVGKPCSAHADADEDERAEAARAREQRGNAARREGGGFPDRLRHSTSFPAACGNRNHISVVNYGLKP